MTEDKLLQLKKDMDYIFSMTEGANILKTLKKLCLFDISTIAINNNNDIDPLSSVYNEGRRSVYLSIRKFIDKEILKEIESEI